MYSSGRKSFDRPHLLGGLEHSVTEHFSKEAPREIASDRLLTVVLLVPSIDLQGGLLVHDMGRRTKGSH